MTRSYPRTAAGQLNRSTSSATGPPINETAGPDRPLLVATVFWLIVNFIRPQDMVPVLGAVHPGAVATTFVILALSRRLREVHWSDRMLVSYFVIMLVVTSGVAFAVNTYWLFQGFMTLLWQGVVGFLALPLLLRNAYSRRVVGNTMVVSFITAAVWTASHNGRGQGAFLTDENDVALHLSIGVPYCYFLARGATSRWKRFLLLGAAAACVIGIILSFSRGGFLALAAAIVAMGFYSRKAVRFFVVAGMLIVLAIPVLASLQPGAGRGKSRSYLDELSSIGDKNDSTRLERLYTWTGGWVMFKANPILGVGAGNFAFAITHYEDNPEMVARNLGRSFGGRAAHSVYFTLLPELGSIGVGAYLALLLGTLRRTWIASRPAEHDELASVAAGVGAGLVAYSVAGIFLSALYYPQFWILTGMASALSGHSAAPDKPPIGSVRRKSVVPRGSRASHGSQHG